MPAATTSNKQGNQSERSSSETRRAQHRSNTSYSTADDDSLSPPNPSYAQNPFSPPESVRSFSSDSPAATPGALPAISRTPSSYFGPSDGNNNANNKAGNVGEGIASGAQTPNASGMRTPREAFAMPPTRPMTISSMPVSSRGLARPRPKSTMLDDTTVIEKPWTEKKDKSSLFAYLITYGVMSLGVAASVARGYLDWQSTPVIKSNLCPVVDEDFSGGPDSIFGENGLFMREVDMSGFGNQEFEMATSYSNNSYLYNNQLYITPTLTSDNIGMDAVLNGYVYNITDCTYNQTRGHSYQNHGEAGSDSTGNGNGSNDEPFDEEAYLKACSAVSNSTTGAIIPPIQSARLRTRTASIRYGKVEVVAKIPRGDWLWPAIWMLPTDNAYGAWPLSGEIDIMEARGNGIEYPSQGVDVVRGSLNWGPLSWLNAVYKTYGWWSMRRSTYADSFHTYSLEWTEDFIRIYVDSRLHHMLELKIKQSFWDRGDFPAVVQNGTESIALQNPWVNGTKAAPFDQSFYLIISMAVGGTNGWFPDRSGDKPWLDNSLTAAKDFLNAMDKWYPTWPENSEDRSLIVDSVKMWSLC